MDKARLRGVELAYDLVAAPRADAQSAAGLVSEASAAEPAGALRGPLPAVLLNGVAMSVGNWRPLLPFLGRRDCLLHDFRGQLLSSRGVGHRADGSYSLRGHAEDLRALLDLLGLGRVHLVGTSYGSEVGMEFALAFPERTASLTVIDGAADCDALLRSAVEGWKATALADPRAFYRSIQAWNYSADYLARNAAVLASREAAVASFPRDWFADFARLCDAFLAVDLLPRLGAVRAPSFVLVGQHDILKHPGYARRIAAAIPGAEFGIIPGVGHAAVIEAPEPVGRAVGDFIERAERRAARLSARRGG
jgi:3-oxoadipate enol-lactonase